MNTEVEAGEKSKLSTAAKGNTSNQANVEGNRSVPTEAELEAEIERIKDEVLEGLLLYDRKRKKWQCKSCRHRCSLPYCMREHILSNHFEGPLERCSYCEIFCKTEAALKKHVYC